MSLYDAAFVNSQLSKPTSIFGLRLWVVIGILVGCLIVLILFLISFCLTSRHRSRTQKAKPKPTAVDLPLTPIKSKEIQEIVNDLHVKIRKPEHRVVVYSDRTTSGESIGTLNSGYETTSFGSGNVVGLEVSHLGWGRWYTLRELEAATNRLCKENVIGE
ncbi:hypothetical protein ACFX13_002632 [Malus domestica]